MASLIPDGYTLTATVALEDSLEPSVTVLYRPLPLRTADSVLRTASTLPEPQVGSFLRSLLSERLVDGFAIPFEVLSVAGLQSAARQLMGISFMAQLEAELQEGVWLDERYPHFRNFSCEQCRYWWMDPQTGTMDEPTPRPAEDSLQCETEGMSCPRGHWSRPRGLSEQNRQALEHFRECDATGNFPTDPVVANNARVIRDAIKRALRHAEQERSMR